MAAEAVAAVWSWIAEAGAGTVVAEGAADSAAIGAGTAAGGTSLAEAAAYGAGSAAAGSAASTLLAPKPPGARPTVGMPDQKSVEEARRRSLMQQSARRGRASTILTQDDTLG